MGEAAILHSPYHFRLRLLSPFPCLSAAKLVEAVGHAGFTEILVGLGKVHPLHFVKANPLRLALRSSLGALRSAPLNSTVP